MKATIVLITITLFSQLSLAQFTREPGSDGLYIAEWDLAFPDIQTLNSYYQNRNSKLIINTIGSKKIYDVWSKGERKRLTYCISDAFGENKEDTIKAMKLATQDWMDTGAGIRFIYKSSEDFNCDPENKKVTFDIRPVNFGLYLARAFFPNYKREQRNILIDVSSFEYSFVALTGFLRHELGHVLGFRHEHISKEANGSCPEDGNFNPLTEYDQLSVMHYPQCGGKNNIHDMILSELDKNGILSVYPGT